MEAGVGRMLRELGVMLAGRLRCPRGRALSLHAAMFTHRVGGQGNAIGSVRLAVCFHSSFSRTYRDHRFCDVISPYI